MVAQIATENIPRTLAEFLEFDPEDGHKYEWNDGELIKFQGMNKRQLFIYDLLLELFIEKKLNKNGILALETDVMLTGIQMRRPDIAYFTRQQVYAGKEGEDVIPAFVIEIISPTDNAEKVEEKRKEYFKAGVEIVWYILPYSETIYVYTDSKNAKICTETDICSASPVLSDFEISVQDLLLL